MNKQDTGCKSTQADKVEKQIVYHEFGHVLGYYFSNELGFKFGEIEKIALEDKNTFVKLFPTLYEFPEKFDSSDSEKLLGEVNDNKRKFICYVLYVVSGAVFNVYYFPKMSKDVAFKKIFDNNNKTKDGKITARAGKDFRWIDRRMFHLKWGHYNLKKIINISRELFDILDKNLVFKHLIAEKRLIEVFEEKFNGRITSSEQTKDKQMIEDLLKNIDDAIPLSNKEKLKSDINSLIDKYVEEITRCQIEII